VLASIRRAIDESAHGPAPDRLGGSMAELRVKFDTPANEGTRSRRSYDHPATAGSSQPQGFAGILSGKRDYGEARPRPTFRSPEPVMHQPASAVSPDEDQGQNVYDGYYGAQVEEYQEPAAEPEAYQPPRGLTPPPRFSLPPPAVIPSSRQSLVPNERLMSDASSDATQAAFNRLAETLTRRALGERPITDMAQDMLKSMLKQWLDENLPKLVEKLVREEIERVVRRPSR
jgi:cell pole-organizing protein PopZ